jgi:predicted permease
VRFSKFLRPERRKSDLDEEIAAHLALAAADKEEQGADPESAQHEARREFGNVALVKDRTREAWGWVWLERLLQDARYALRQMRKSPGFAAAVIGTLALGIAAATTMFTVVDGVLFRPLPYPHASRLVDVNEGSIRTDTGVVPYLDIAAWRKQAHGFEQIAYYNYAGGRRFLGATTAASTEVDALDVSPNLFATLGVSPQIGPGLSAAPETFTGSATSSAIVLSDAAWRTVFDSDPKIIGKTVQINNTPYSVAGVMPRGFAFPFQASPTPQVWIPNQLGKPDEVRNDKTPGYQVIARLRPGVSLSSGLAELSALQKQIAQNYTDADQRAKASRVRIDSYATTLVDSSTAKALYALLAAAMLLWLIACINSTNLLLARAIARQREMAMRGALGAGRWRLTQQLIVESSILSGVAALLGAAIATTLVALFRHELNSHLPFNVPSSISLPVLAALIGLTLVSTMLAASWPAWIAARTPIEPVLRQGGQQSGTSRRHHHLRGGLVIAEIAMSLTLLAACGLMLRTIYALRHVPLGFRTNHIVVADLAIPGYRFSKVNLATNLYTPLLDGVEHLPGVDSAGLMTDVPLSHFFMMQLTMYRGNGQKPVDAFFKAVTPSLQNVFGFHMLAGRYFNAQDTASTPQVAVVNESFAHVFDPTQQDITKVLDKKLMGGERGKPGEGVTIVGVLDDFRQRSVDHAPVPEIDLSLTQLTPKNQFYGDLEGAAMDLVVRAQLPLAQIIPEIRSALRQADPALANSNITTMDQIVEDSYGSQRLAAHLLESFATAALLLCIAGLYGLLAYVVSQRTREMGVRFALGAQRADVIWLILRQAGVLVLAGVALGLALAFATSRFIRSYLYGVKAHDAWTLAAVALVLLVAGAAAAYLPARRAAHVDPVDALRAD